MKINKTLNTALAGSALALLAVSGSAWADNDEASTTYKFGGYAKFDAMFTSYSDATPGNNTLMRQFYYTPQIPVGDGSGDSDITADFQARETRLNFRVDHKTGDGSSVTAFVEFDFLIDNNNGNGDGNEVVSNSWKPRMRHAFIKYDNWTFGQTWSTFMDVSVLPEALDFVGPNESTTFVRQSMIRYTSGNLELAAENPETFVSGGTLGRSTIPDLIGRYTFKLDGGSYVRLAGLVRNLKLAEDANGAQPDATGWGVSASAKFMVGDGDLRAMVTYGDGVGRYIGLGFVRDGYVTTDANGNADIETAEALAAFASYRWKWNEKWRSNLMYGFTSIDYDNDALAGGLNDSGSSFHFNVICNVLPKLDIGGEVIWGQRELVNGTDGDFTRFQLSAKYAF